MSTAVVLLNWNGTEDTLECVASLRKAEPDMHLVIVDNGSRSQALAALREGLAALGLNVSARGAAEVDRADATAATSTVQLILSEDNLGFAGGCNLGLRAAAAAAHCWTVFLNNDTIVEAGALELLVERLAIDPGVAVTLPLIGVHGTRRVWNAGGRLWPAVGLRRYHHAGDPLDAVRDAEIACSFFTGCCFAIATDRMMDRGGFSERFFFGEEDMELSYWMDTQGLRARCLTRALVWHKVSAAVNRASGPHVQRRIQAHYLNRLVHMRLRWGTVRWALWLGAYLPYTALLLWRQRQVPAVRLPGFLAAIVRVAARHDHVDRSMFQTIMAGGFDTLDRSIPVLSRPFQ